jgi:hypothetical protein
VIKEDAIGADGTGLALSLPRLRESRLKTPPARIANQDRHSPPTSEVEV